MYVHLALSLSYAVYLSRPYLFEDHSFKYSEVLSELVGMILSTLIMQFIRQDLGAKERDMVGVLSVSLICLFILASFFNMLYSCIREKCRARRLKK